jgi:hypothetical protein
MKLVALFSRRPGEGAGKTNWLIPLGGSSAMTCAIISSIVTAAHVRRGARGLRVTLQGRCRAGARAQREPAFLLAKDASPRCPTGSPVLIDVEENMSYNKLSCKSLQIQGRGVYPTPQGRPPPTSSNFAKVRLLTLLSSRKRPSFRDCKSRYVKVNNFYNTDRQSRIKHTSGGKREAAFRRSGPHLTGATHPPNPRCVERYGAPRLLPCTRRRMRIYALLVRESFRHVLGWI